ncbi:MAG: carboxypeptidase regulatory-like domain-containing protein [Rhodobacteraceae bacterium]|nr:carboxypeptidase regulatory-like domain-containing protein [Paracoccaceae bacterium]
MFAKLMKSALSATVFLMALNAHQGQSAEPAKSETDFISGVVTGPSGPEAGVWVIAETNDLATPFSKVVVTDDEGRYVLPQLPNANYQIWVRGYGLSDSEPVDGTPGQVVDVKVVNAPDAQTAASIYPANYWGAMLEIPAKSEFPGTGPKGNGISPAFKTQDHWLLNLKSRCASCHQLGSQITREVFLDDAVEAWTQKINMARDPGDQTLSNSGNDYKNTMNNGMTSFGRERALKMFADWSVAIGNGAVPSQPPRPEGLERNVVLTMWDWGLERAIHDEVTTDQRNPTVNANGPIYGAIGLFNEDPNFGALSVLDPVSNEAKLVPANRSDPKSQFAPPSGIEWALHTPMLDQKGRVWTTSVTTESTPSPIDCYDPANKYAKYYPIESLRAKAATATASVSMYDPATGVERPIPVCFMTHHLRFAYDPDNTLFFSSIQTRETIGWLNTRVYDETHDSMQAMGWCPLVLDTSGDGKIDPDRTKWKRLTADVKGASEGKDDVAEVEDRNGNAPDENADTQYTFGSYSISVSKADGSIWFGAPSSPHPGGIGRLSLGKNPPETCVTEYYQPPKNADGTANVFFDQGMDLDSKGVAWAAFSSGHLGKFDRSKCKVLNGPTATGQQCPEGWTIYETPGPRFSGTEISGDFHYLIWVDIHNTLGLGEDVPIVAGTNSDSLLAFLPDQEKWVVMRRPYPLGFYARGLDGRIDDPDAGWKGRAVWSADEMIPIFQLETGFGSSGKVVKFQMRPNPLAH